MESEAQKRANKRWQKRNRGKDRLYTDRASAKRYVRKEHRSSEIPRQNC